MKKLLASVALVGLMSLPAAAQDADTVLATIDGVDITVGHVVALRARLPQEYQQLDDEVLFNGILDQMVRQQVLAATQRQAMSRADDLGLENEVRAFLAGAYIAANEVTEFSEADIQAAYDARFGSVDPEPQFNASHILVETEAEAASLVTQLAEGADFAELARTFSTGPSGPNGGQLGWFGLGAMVPSFEQAVLALEVGEVSPPVETQFGWHVVVLNDTRQADVPTLAEVRNDLVASLSQETFGALVDSLEAAATITRTEMEIDPSIVRNDALIAE